MFPHDVTIYHYDNEAYTKTILKGVYLYGSDGISQSGNGISSNHLKTVIIPKNALYEGLEIYPNDRLVKGEGGDIETVKDLTDFVTITSISDNRCNSDLDNIELRCD